MSYISWTICKTDDLYPNTMYLKTIDDSNWCTLGNYRCKMQVIQDSVTKRGHAYIIIEK